MFLDTKYTHNVIFQQNAMQELLDNIRDYPIIDIDYIEQNEKDLKSATATIWDYYTDGTPCIKITYGDKETLKGNVIFAKVFQKAKILGENKKAELINGNIEALDLANKWDKIYQENLEIYNRRLRFLENENTELEELSTKDAETIINELNRLLDEYDKNFDQWYGDMTQGYYETVDPATGRITRRFQQVTLVTLLTNNYKITEDTYCRVGSTYYKKEDGQFIQLTEAQAAIAFGTDPLPEIYERIKLKGNYVLCGPEFKTTIISELEGQKELVNDNDTIEAFDNIIRLLNDYPNYGAFNSLNGGTIDLSDHPENNEPTRIYEYLKSIMEKVVDAAEEKYLNAEIVRDYYRGQIADIGTQIDNINTMLAGCDECIKGIALGQREPDYSSTSVRGVKSENPAVNNAWLNMVMTGERTIDIDVDTTTASGGTDKLLEGIKYVKVGSNIKFYDPLTNNYLTSINASTTQNNGTFRVTINSDTYQVPIKGLEESTTNTLVVSVPAQINNLYPTTGSTTSSVGELNNPYAHGYFDEIKIGDVTIGGSGGTGDAGKFLRGDGAWSDTIVGSLKFNASTANNATTNVKISNNDNNGTISSGSGTSLTYSINTAAAIYTKGGIAAEKNIWAAKVFNAVFNDYAECRKSTIISAGYVVIDQDDGTMIPSNERLQPGAQVVSDTYGHLMGMTEGAKTPIAVAGRVLAYTYRPREEYHAGMAVCSAPGGTIDIMSREEIRDYPDCIIGIVSEIPDYDIWGSDNIKVNGRIWIKVR